jgi:hypothetical protein
MYTVNFQLRTKIGVVYLKSNYRESLINKIYFFHIYIAFTLVFDLRHFRCILHISWNQSRRTFVLWGCP